MASMPWIKLYTEILDDPKLGRLDPETKWRFVELCLMAGECDAEGYLVNGDTPLTINEIAWRLRADPDHLAGSMGLLEDAGVLFQDNDDTWVIVSFAKRQGRSQSEKREQWRERKRRQRQRPRDTEQDIEERPDDVPRDNAVSPDDVTPLEESRVEETREDTRGPAGAGASAPSTFPEWLALVQEPPDGSNRTAVLVNMHQALYPGRDPPTHGFTGTVAKQVGGAGRLADLLWQNSTRPPTGDVLRYILGQFKGQKREKDNGSDQQRHYTVQGWEHTAATSEEFYGSPTADEKQVRAGPVPGVQ